MGSKGSVETIKHLLSSVQPRPTLITSKPVNDKWYTTMAKFRRQSGIVAYIHVFRKCPGRHPARMLVLTESYIWKVWVWLILNTEQRNQPPLYHKRGSQFILACFVSNAAFAKAVNEILIAQLQLFNVNQCHAYRSGGWSWKFFFNTLDFALVTKSNETDKCKMKFLDVLGIDQTSIFTFFKSFRKSTNH